MNLRYESLHNHTKISDGTESHLELLKSAEKHGFGVMAFTDHDVLPTPEIMTQLRAYHGPVKWTVGIELSTGLPTELGGFANGSLHVLGYFIDLENKPLNDYLAKIMAGRIERVGRIVEHAKSVGLDVTVDEVLAQAAGSPPGSPHAVRAIMAKAANVERLDQIEADMKRDAEHNPELAELYEKMLAGGAAQRPFTLFMKQSSYLPMPDAEIGDSLADFDAGVKLIRGAGGVAMIAHWYFHEKKFPKVNLEEILRTNRVDGVEVAVANIQEEGDYTAGAKYLAEQAAKYDRLTAIGIDTHYEADFEFFLKSPYAEQTVGQSAKLIDQLKPNLKFSTL